MGAPLATERLIHERLGKPTALAVFASDNLSSSAYATEEILRVLVVAGLGTAAFSKVVPITIALLLVLGVLLFSYRQTIRAYPQAGGAYLVTRDNFGVKPAQVAGVALLTDYVLTVSVSVAAGTAALTSVFEGLHAWRVPISLAFIVILTFGNLRGVRESGRIFATPTYFFLLMMGILLATSFVRLATGDLPQPAQQFPLPPTEPLAGFALVFLILKAFASGGAAVTGVEAISNGVPAFKPPEWRNAITTLMWMGSLLGAMFLGLSILAARMHVVPDPNEKVTVLAQIARGVFGHSAIGRRALHRGPGGDDADPRPGGEHQLRRLPAPGELPRGRPLPADAAHTLRRPPRVLERDRGPVGVRGAAGDRVQGERHEPDPALRDRRLHLVHVLPGRHGEAPHDAARDRGGRRGSRSTASAPS